MKQLIMMVSLAVLAGIQGCTSLSMPPMADAVSQEPATERVVWHDLITDTPEQSRRFYSELFGWQFQALSIDAGQRSVEYDLIRNHQGRLIAGLVNQNQLGSEHDLSQWVTVFAVADAQRTKVALERAGGTVFGGPVNVLNRGQMMVAADSQGAIFATLANATQVPTASALVQGDFLWDELWTKNTEQARNEYQALLQLTPKTLEDDYTLLQAGQSPRAGVMKNPLPGLSSVWVNYLKLDSNQQLDDVIKRVPALGGKILVAPQQRSGVGRVAFISGPSGAGIALQVWSGDAQARMPASLNIQKDG